MSKTQVRLIAICDYEPFRVYKVRHFHCAGGSYDIFLQRGREVPDGRTASSCQTAAWFNGAEGNSRSTSSFSMLQVVAGL